MKMTLIPALTITLSVWTAHAAEYHVSTAGDDANTGTKAKPFRTIQLAADIAQPGDTVTVHEGVYRERINPPRGGTADNRRIIYRAAPGESVVIKGSEVVKGWEKTENDTWKVVLTNAFFGGFNPFKDLIRGDWFKDNGRDHHTGAVYLNGHWLVESADLDSVLQPADPSAKDLLWFAEVGEESTTIWAQFREVDPNAALVEVNARRTVFYPEKPGCDYIIVRGFTLEHAATPWGPPTAEQIGLVGTHWSRGWIIEDNTIRYSACVGVTLGKYGDAWDNRSQSADAYNLTIQRALTNGWSKANVGSHVVKNNHISHCEQAGIVGSLGAVFSTISGNEIHDIHVRRLFHGHEIAGIKLHAPIDVLIIDNYIHHTVRGIWLDWMTQGARVTRNLLHDNDKGSDLFVEVNHGPFLVDHNISLSSKFLSDWSNGGAYAHNLAAGEVRVKIPQKRETPYHKAHSTEIAGLYNIPGGDNRFFNNVFAQQDRLAPYDVVADTMKIDGNVVTCFKAGLIEEDDGLYLELDLAESLSGDVARKLVTTELLGRTKISSMPFDRPDGTPYTLDRDYFGNRRNTENPRPGPFAAGSGKGTLLKVWPRE